MITTLIVAHALDCLTSRQVGSWVVGHDPVAYVRVQGPLYGAGTQPYMGDGGCRISWDSTDPRLADWCTYLGADRCRWQTEESP